MSFFNQLFNTDKKHTQGTYLYFRIFEAVVIYQVLLFSWKWGLYIPQLGEVILPLGLANYLDISFMFSGPYSLINAALITFFVALAFLRKGRYFYLLAVLAMHLQYIARFSQGEISHGSNLTGTALVTLALGACFFADEVQRQKSTLGMLVFLIGLGYVSASISKFIGTGVNWIDGRHLYLWIGERATDRLSQDGAFSLNFLQKTLLEHYWMATLTLLIGIGTELLGFLLWFRKLRWLGATLLICMHFGVSMSMSISFNAFVVILFVIGYPWERLFDFLLEKYSDSGFGSFLQKRLVTKSGS